MGVWNSSDQIWNLFIFKSRTLTKQKIWYLPIWKFLVPSHTLTKPWENIHTTSTHIRTYTHTHTHSPDHKRPTKLRWWSSSHSRGHVKRPKISTLLHAPAYQQRVKVRVHDEFNMCACLQCFLQSRVNMCVYLCEHLPVYIAFRLYRTCKAIKKAETQAR
jgi:hypothetical protein